MAALRQIQTLPLFADTNWLEVSKRNRDAAKLFARHYSANPDKQDKWVKHGLTAPGESVTLMTWQRDALFVWYRSQWRKDNQTGVECAVFRNESQIQSSTLIVEAMQIARRRWGDVRMYTFVDADKVRSRNPGYCFKCAGWVTAGKSARGLRILEYTSL